MRKYFEGHSLTGVVIILAVFSFAVALRFFDISSQSPWMDELASWWYMRNLGEVWGRESHSPLYYAILRIFTGESDIGTLRIFTATVSVIHLIECFFLGQLAFSKKHFLIFWILICLNPADIVYARMARHYSWLFEGILVYYLLWRIKAPLWMQAMTGAFMGFIHVFAVIPVGLLALYRFWQERNKKYLAVMLVSTNLIIVYYILRIIFLGHEQVSVNVSWNAQTLVNFWSSIVTQFLGDAYPRFEYFPVRFWEAFLVVAPTSLWAFYKRRESGILFASVAIASLLVIEVLGMWLNLRVCRYVIYLIGFWFVAFVDSIDDVKDWQIYSVLAAVSTFLLLHNPLTSFPFEREKVGEWKSYSANFPDTQRLVCANNYQVEYFELNAQLPCNRAVTLVDYSQPLILFDLNNCQKFVSVFLSNLMDVKEIKDLKTGSITYFEPKKSENGKAKK
ncbi:MAG: hypothetical protein V4598_01940 [Bdellovibrionota bacterium]